MSFFKVFSRIFRYEKVLFLQTKLDILFIGKNNSVNTELYNDISAKFSSQIAGDSLYALQNTLAFVMPDMIVFSLAGYGDNDFIDILEHLYRSITSTPVLVICDSKQYTASANYFTSKRFFLLSRPTTNENILFACRQIIDSNGNISQLQQLSCQEPPKAHILIIDDNAMTLRVTKRMLDDKYSVAIAVSGSQAFMSIAMKKPDVILLDYEMPLINGETAMIMLKENEDTKNIPVIFFTGAADSETVHKLLALNPAGYLLKPPDKQKLVELIEKTIKR